MTAPTEQDMAVRLLYSLDHDQSQFVAKPSTPFRVSVHSDFNIGFCRLDKCLLHLVQTCSDLASADYGVFSADVSEENAPLTSHGKLASVLNTTVESVPGMVKTNLLNQSMFEVRLHFKKLASQPALAPQGPQEHHGHAQHHPPQEPQRALMPPSSPPPVKRYHTLPPSSSALSDYDLQVRPSFFYNTGHMDGPMIRTTFDPSAQKSKKRTAAEQLQPMAKPQRRRVPRCSNCGCFYSTIWRWGEDFTVLCNPCGLYPRTHKGAMRPKSLWKPKREKNPDHWRIQPEGYPAAGNSPFSCYELTDLDHLEASKSVAMVPTTAKSAEFVAESESEAPSEAPAEAQSEASNQEPEEETPGSTPVPSSPGMGPVAAGRQETIADKENQPPFGFASAPSAAPRGSMTPTRPPPADQPDSHHKWMARYIHSQEPEHDIFEAFMRSPSKHPSRQLEIELSSVLSSSPPTSSTIFDSSEQELTGVSADWFKTTDRARVAEDHSWLK